jgi:hypothetical protein
MMSIDPADSDDEEEASRIPSSGRGTPLPGAKTPTGAESGADRAVAETAEPENQVPVNMEEGEGQTEVANHTPAPVQTVQTVDKHIDHVHHSGRHVSSQTKYL